MRRFRWLWVIAALGVAAAITAAVVAVPRGERIAPPSVSASDRSGASLVGERPSDPALRFGDGTYLDGHEYLRGVNIYSLIFAGRQDDLSVLGEPQRSYDFLASRGVSIVRLAVPWQRLQEIPRGGTAADGLAEPIDDVYLDVVAEQVRRAAAAGIRTIIDLHNGCTYPWGAGDFVEGSLRCGDGIAEQHVAAIWTSIAERFAGDERVIAYDIFNEPRWSVGIDTYKRYAQVAVDAIRSTGDGHTVWVEGILSDERGRLAAIAPDGPWIEDPLGKTMYSEHFYAEDDDGDGTPERTVLERLSTFADWCDFWQVRCSVGEVGWPSSDAVGDTDAEAWDALFEEFYSLADESRLDVTYFAASGSSDAGTLLAYVASRPGVPSPGIEVALSQTAVIERHLSRPSEAERE